MENETMDSMMGPPDLSTMRGADLREQLSRVWAQAEQTVDGLVERARATARKELIRAVEAQFAEISNKMAQVPQKVDAALQPLAECVVALEGILKGLNGGPVAPMSVAPAPESFPAQPVPAEPVPTDAKAPAPDPVPEPLPPAPDLVPAPPVDSGPPEPQSVREWSVPEAPVSQEDYWIGPRTGRPRFRRETKSEAS